MARRRVISFLAWAAGIGLILYLSAAALVTLNQHRLIYFPDVRRIAPAAAGLPDFKAVEIAASDGERLVAWWKPPAEPGGGVVLYLHGNGGNVAYRADRFRDLADTGLGVLGLDWRGYGGSTGTPSEAGLTLDARAGYDWAAANAPGSKIVLFGESLGTAPAIVLAGKSPVVGVVLDSPFASVLRMGQRTAPWLPVRLLLRDRYDSEVRVRDVRAPLLILHCAQDRVIPMAEGQRLFEAANEPKEMVVLQGCDHVETWRGQGRTRALDRLTVWTAHAAGEVRP